jgi:hypothetical protein
MTASPRQSRSSPETERDGDSIGADGPVQRYTHTTGTPPGQPLPLHYRAVCGTFVSPSGLSTSAVASTRSVSLRLRVEDANSDSGLFRPACGSSHGEASRQEPATEQQPAGALTGSADQIGGSSSGGPPPTTRTRRAWGRHGPGDGLILGRCRCRGAPGAARGSQYKSGADRATRH